MSALGGVTVFEQPELKEMTQRQASAWSTVEGLIGVRYKPVLYVGTQIVQGMNHVFLAEQTTIGVSDDRRLVLVTVNEYENTYRLVGVTKVI